MKKSGIAFGVLCLLGLGVSAELTRIHWLVHTDPSYHSVCALSEGVNCETVALSPYSVFAGLPVSVWGMIGYLTMGGFALWSLFSRHRSRSWGILLGLTSVSLLVSIGLAVLSATRIDSFCLFCMASYGINALLFGMCIAVVRRLERPIPHLLMRDLRVLWSRPVVAASLLAVGTAGFATLQIAMPAYWRTLGWDDLPALETGVDEQGHHYVGAESPKVTIEEFSDYECPHCRHAHKSVRVLVGKHSEDVRLVHRHLPLDQACHPKLKRPFHKRACLFAQAAECAGKQNRFFEMNDALFAIQDTVKTEDVDLVDLAVRIGLKRSEFKSCLETGATMDRVASDVQEALKRSLRGTPSFFIGDKLFVGRISEKVLESLIKEGSRKQGIASR